MLRKSLIYIFFSSVFALAVTQIDFYGMAHPNKPDVALMPIVVTTVPIEPIRDPVVTFNDIDTDAVECMATNMYHEARGEGDLGKIAVGYVTYNRANDQRFPSTICDVVYQARYSKWWLETKGRLVPIRWQCQFTWYCDGRSDAIDKSSAAWEKSVELSIMLLAGKLTDPTDGATHYFNHHLADPAWQHTMVFSARIHNHSFYY